MIQIESPFLVILLWIHNFHSFHKNDEDGYLYNKEKKKQDC